MKEDISWQTKFPWNIVPIFLILLYFNFIELTYVAIFWIKIIRPLKYVYRILLYLWLLEYILLKLYEQNDSVKYSFWKIFVIFIFNDYEICFRHGSIHFGRTRDCLSEMFLFEVLCSNCQKCNNDNIFWNSRVLLYFF